MPSDRSRASAGGCDHEGVSQPPQGDFAQVSAGTYHTCAVRPLGTIECWGMDYHGETEPP